MRTASKQEVVSEINNGFRGIAKIKFASLAFGGPHMHRALDHSNIARLLRIFKKQGCWNSSPLHHVRAVISRVSLSNSLTNSGLGEQELMNLSTLPHFLKFPVGLKLRILSGHHRLLAADNYLQDKWWLVELYDDRLSRDAQLALCEGDPTIRCINSGEKFRSLRLSQKSANREEENRWRAHLTATEEQTFNYIFRDQSILSDPIDQLLLFPGLWPGLPLGSLHDFIYMRCAEELRCYLLHINNCWELIIGEKYSLKALIDVTTVRKLETLFPKFSEADRLLIKSMTSQGIIFPAVHLQEERDMLVSNLLNIPGRIPSFYTFSLDFRYLKSLSGFIRELLPPDFRGSIRENFLQSRSSDKHCMLHYSDHSVLNIEYESDEVAAAVAYCQLYLSVMRDGVTPRKGKPARPGKLSRLQWLSPVIDDQWWYRLARLARSLGFDTERIRHLSDPSRVAQAVVETAPIQGDGNRLLEYTTDACSLSKRQRCGIPDAQGHEHVRKYLFFDVVSADIDPARKQNATILAAQWDILLSWFGDLGIFQSADNHTSFNPGSSIPQSMSVTQVGQAMGRSPAPPARPISSVYSNHEEQDSGSYDSLFDTIDTQLAPGFELNDSKPMEEFHPLQAGIASDMIRTFLRSEEKPLVLFDYHNREYIKYLNSRIVALEQFLQELASQGRMYTVFLKIDRFVILEYDNVLKEEDIWTTKLILIGRRGNFFPSSSTQDGFLDWIDSMASKPDN